MQFTLFRLVVLSPLVWFGFLTSLSGAADLEAILQEATKKREAGDIAGAIDGYSRIVELDPKAEEVWFERGTARMIRGDWSGAQADFAQTIRLNPLHVAAYRLRAAALQEEKDFDGAMADLERAVALDPEHSATYATRGEIRSAQERWDEALKEFDHAIRLDDSSWGVFFRRAKVYNARGEGWAALDDLSRVLRMNPEFAEGWRERAAYHFRDYEWKEAIADAQKALELEAKSAESARVIGFSQFGAGNYAASAKTLAEAADWANENVVERAFGLFIRHLALKRLDAPDERLKKEVSSWDPDWWVTTIGRYLLGEVSEEELDEMAEVGDPEHRDGRGCEANFYIGVLRLHAGDRSTARLRFRTAVANKMPDYVEYVLAWNELFALDPWRAGR